MRHLQQGRRVHGKRGVQERRDLLRHRLPRVHQRRGQAGGHPVRPRQIVHQRYRDGRHGLRRPRQLRRRQHHGLRSLSVRRRFPRHRMRPGLVQLPMHGLRSRCERHRGLHAGRQLRRGLQHRLRPVHGLQRRLLGSQERQSCQRGTWDFEAGNTEGFEGVALAVTTSPVHSGTRALQSTSLGSVYVRRDPICPASSWFQPKTKTLEGWYEIRPSVPLAARCRS